MNPYQIAAANGNYYLIGNYDKYDNVSNYRLERIKDIQMLDSRAKPMDQVEGLENGLDLPKHMAEHIYMYSGKSGTVTFRMKKYLVTDAFDWFGSDIEFFDEADDEVSARIRVNLQAMQRWAVQYAPHAWVLSPENLVEEAKDDIKAAMENYEMRRDE